MGLDDKREYRPVEALSEELFSPQVLEHLKKLGKIIVKLGGYGSIKIDIFRDEIAHVSTEITTKRGSQF